MRQTKDRLVHLKPEELKAVAAECPEILAAPGLTRENESYVHLMAAGAYGLLAKQKIDRRSNAARAFNEVRRAYGLAPDSAWCANSYARALTALDNLNWFLKKLATTALDVNLKGECRRVLPSLARHPDDPLSAVLRVKMAEIGKDRNARAEAEKALQALTARNPAGVRKALGELNGDANLAREAKDEGK